MEEVTVKLFLAALVATPFAALLSDVLGRTNGLMLRAVMGVSITFTLGLFLVGFQERPNFANLVFAAFCGWPVVILLAKGLRPSISWCSIGISVPIMSWFLVNLMIGLSDGNPLSVPFGLIFGWLYMTIPFAILIAIYASARTIIGKLRVLK